MAAKDAGGDVGMLLGKYPPLPSPGWLGGFCFGGVLCGELN